MASVYLVARHHDVAYVRALGLANMKNAPVLDAFLTSGADGHIQSVCVDLSACTGMDSTFMGLLVGSASRLRDAGGKLVIVNPTESNLRLLRTLGVADVVPVLEGCQLPTLEFVSLSGSSSLGTLQRMELVRRAHRNLMELNETNQAKFAAFLKALEADLAKLVPAPERNEMGAAPGPQPVSLPPPAPMQPPVARQPMSPVPLSAPGHSVAPATGTPPADLPTSAPVSGPSNGSKPGSSAESDQSDGHLPDAPAGPGSGA